MNKNIFEIGLWLFLILVSVETFGFSKQQIRVAKIPLKVEVANSDGEHARGLMFRKSLPEGTGMLFVFPNEETRRFWMKNTFIDLSIGFFNSKKVLIDIQEMSAVKSEMELNPPSYTSAGPAQYVLEVPRNWFHKHKIKIGDKLVLE